MERPHTDGARLNCRVGIMQVSWSQTKRGTQISKQKRVVMRTMNVNTLPRPTLGYTDPSALKQKPAIRTSTAVQPLGENRSYFNVNSHQGSFNSHYDVHCAKPCPPRASSKPQLPTRVRQEVFSENVYMPYAHGQQASYCTKQESYKTYIYNEAPPVSHGYIDDDLDIIPPPPPPPPPEVHQASPHYPGSYSQHALGSGYDHDRYYPNYHNSCPQAKPVLPAVNQTSIQPLNRLLHHAPYNCAQAPSQATQAIEPVRAEGDLRQIDIVCGRGAPTNYHYGNQVFKEVVEEYQTKYLCAKRSDKPHIAMKIFDIVKESGARFVKRDKAAGRFCWVEIDRKGAYDKICQALREGAPDLRRRVLSAAKKRATKQAK